MSDLQNPATVWREAIGEVARLLEDRGVLRAPARAMAEAHGERLYLSPTGKAIVAAADGTIYPADHDPLRMLADELFENAPEDVKSGSGSEGDLVRRAAERFQRQRDQRGVNPLARGSAP
jgi:hypothetical protein